MAKLEYSYECPYRLLTVKEMQHLIFVRWLYRNGRLGS